MARALSKNCGIIPLMLAILYALGMFVWDLLKSRRHHADAIASIDMFVVPTVTFERLFAFLILGHGRRQLLWFEVTRHPTALWLA